MTQSSAVHGPARQTVLESYPFDSADVAERLDRLAHLAAQICEAPIGLVTIIDDDRQHFVGRCGLDMTETPREYSFCAHAMVEPGGLVVSDAARDSRFRDNPLVTQAPAIRFYAGMPLASIEGVPLGALCVIDTAARVGLTAQQSEGLETLARAASDLLERRRLERSSDQFRVRSQAEIVELEQRFHVLADAMPQLVWSTTAEGMVDYVNRGWCEFLGQSAEASFGRKWMQFLHDEDKLPAAQFWARAIESGANYEIEYRMLHHDGSYRWVLARGIPVRDDDGAIMRWIGTCTDIHEQKADGERQELLSRELSHRIKNIFAVIGGLIALTTRSRPEFRDTATELRERILALGRAHDFVRSRGGRATLDPHQRLIGLLQTLLAPYQDAQIQRITIIGADVEIDDRSATPLALFFHELATNAAKYGSLSHGDGRVAIEIALGKEVELSWRETGGPPVRASQTPGFGTTLIEMSIVRQLGGSIAYDWSEQGLCVVARIPASLLAR